MGRPRCSPEPPGSGRGGRLAGLTPRARRLAPAGHVRAERAEPEVADPAARLEAGEPDLEERTLPAGRLHEPLGEAGGDLDEALERELGGARLERQASSQTSCASKKRPASKRRQPSARAARVDSASVSIAVGIALDLVRRRGAPGGGRGGAGADLPLPLPPDPLRRRVGGRSPRREGRPRRPERRRQVHDLPADHARGGARRRPGLGRSRRHHRLLQPGRRRDDRPDRGRRDDGRRRPGLGGRRRAARARARARRSRARRRDGRARRALRRRAGALRRARRLRARGRAREILAGLGFTPR